MKNRPMNTPSLRSRVGTFVRDYRNTSLYTAVMVTVVVVLEVLERLQ